MSFDFDSYSQSFGSDLENIKKTSACKYRRQI